MDDLILFRSPMAHAAVAVSTVFMVHMIAPQVKANTATTARNSTAAIVHRASDRLSWVWRVACLSSRSDCLECWKGLPGFH